jgi:hypothetical protein
MDFSQLTTTDLIDLVGTDNTATARELALLDRLLGAIDEVERLTCSLGRMEAVVMLLDEER